jgi:hypothetical protein
MHQIEKRIVDITYQEKRKILQEEKKAYIDAIQQMNELKLKI